MQTYAPKPADITRKWYIIDAAGLPLGRLASEVAQILRGKHKPIFAPHVDVGDFVVVINAAAIKLTGRKAEQKTYFSHSGYLGGGKHTSYKKWLAEDPTRIIHHAVKGMLPHNRLGRAMLKKLKVYPGANHPHQAQQPLPLQLKVAERYHG